MNIRTLTQIEHCPSEGHPPLSRTALLLLTQLLREAGWAEGPRPRPRARISWTGPLVEEIMATSTNSIHEHLLRNQDELEMGTN